MLNRGGHLDESKSTNDYVFLLNNDIISWSSKKQTCVALSTMKVKFLACFAVVQEVVWLRYFMSHLGVIGGKIEPVRLYCDSQAVITYMKDSKYHCRMKHIGTKYNFVRDVIAQKEVTQ